MSGLINTLTITPKNLVLDKEKLVPANWEFYQPVCWITYGDYREKLHVSHFWELKGWGWAYFIFGQLFCNLTIACSSHSLCEGMKREVTAPLSKLEHTELL